MPKNDLRRQITTRDSLLEKRYLVNTEYRDIAQSVGSVFEQLVDELLPNSKVEINLVIESDGNLIWQADAACRVIITKLIVRRLLFNSEGQKLYMNEYLDTRKWPYLRASGEQQYSATNRDFQNINRGLTTTTRVCFHNQ